MYMLDICMNSLGNGLFKFPAHFKIRLFGFLLLRCMYSLYILDINPLSNVWFTNIFSHFSRLTFHCVDDFLCCPEAFQLHVVSFIFCFLCSWCQIQRIITEMTSRRSPPLCPSRGFTFQVLCSSLYHFELIFMCGVRWWCSFVPLYVTAHSSSHRLPKRLSFPHFILVVPLLEIHWPRVHEFISGLSV